MKPTTSGKSSSVGYAKPALSAAMQARKALLRRIQKQEIRRLQAMVPCLANRPRRQIDDVTVIEEAARYIDQLHKTLLARVNSGNLSADVLNRFNPAELMRIQQSQQQSNSTRNPLAAVNTKLN